ncbi:DUF2332 domain-containing protein [Microbacterium gorillae]|uniref:DUF2332 domain-containing protein n=1 Tax=Microbacterium gorillae TaxID=1231063 RepID=UPI00058D65DD|nr:DUF2332 domain-containing protein [Microbacterium gorillae]
MSTPEQAATDEVRERYARFARDEAPGRSEVYRRWATGVAADAEVAGIIAALPSQRRQPPLVFAVTRLLGAGEGDDTAEWTAFVRAHRQEIIREIDRRSLQTNEPQRCAALLPALALVDGPIALVELGAAAGLCLYPDRYAYRYRAVDGVRSVGPVGGSGVVLSADLSGPAPLALPQIVWRAGVDLSPLDPADPEDRAWLQALVWPGETGRAERIRSALDIAAADPPSLVSGDAAARLPELVERAPAGATVVVTTPGLLPFLPWRQRNALVEMIQALPVRWVTLDRPGLYEGLRGPVEEVTDGFALALDGEVLADADPLGARVRWLGEADGSMSGVGRTVKP